MTRKELKALIKEAVLEALNEQSEPPSNEDHEGRHALVLSVLDPEDWMDNMAVVAESKLTGQQVNNTLRDLAAWGSVERKKVKARGAAGYKWLNRLAEEE